MNVRLIYLMVAIMLCALLASCGNEGAEVRSNQPDNTKPPRISCEVGQPPALSVGVLVDVSRTWHNPEDRSYNEQLLQIAGNAIHQASQAPRRCPTSVRYHLIGDNSFLRPPVCNGTYVRKLIAGNDQDDPSLILDGDKFKEFLLGTCPLLLNAPPELNTQITASLITALRSMRQFPGSARRMIVYSDMREETQSDFDFTRDNFSGVEILLIYRSLSADQMNQSELDDRIAYWTGALEAAGAKVYAAPDTGIGLNVSELAQFLIYGFEK